VSDLDKLAVVDVGSNSVKLLVLDGDTVLHRDSVVTRLGSGVAKTGVLAADSIDATLNRCREIRDILDAHGVDTPLAVATAAVRSADDSDTFLAAANDALRTDIAVIDGRIEGCLAFLGAQTRLPLDPGIAEIAVFDIGGGSTEFSVGTTGSHAPKVMSIPFGARNITERNLFADPPRPEELTNAIGAVADDIDDVLRDIPELADVSTLVGVAGTVVTIAMVELGLSSFDATLLHGMNLSKDAAEDVFRTLATEKLSDRIHNPGLHPDRADIIVGGCCVLVAVMRKLHVSEITVSTTALTDGVANVVRRTGRLPRGTGSLGSVLQDFFS
jgi:exopolyphosphatase/guanosine-5'-triphosphate,3'-diphosphate pyrophosphatase